MRIGIISDSHGNTNAIDQAVKAAGEIDFRSEEHTSELQSQR